MEYLAESWEFLELGDVAGVFEGDPALGGCPELVEPFPCRAAARGQLVRALDEVDGNLEGGDLAAEVGLLQLW